jgi:hypothetical protein
MIGMVRTSDKPMGSYIASFGFANIRKFNQLSIIIRLIYQKD